MSGFKRMISEGSVGPSYKRQRSAPTSKRTFKSDRYGKAKGGFAKAVKKVIQQTAEKKTAEFTQTDKMLYGYNATGTAWLDSIMPVTPYGASLAINQGVGDSARVGNKITISKLRFKGMIVPLGYNATTNAGPEPQFVKMWLFYDKENPATIPQPGSDFLQANGTASALTGTASDMFAQVNKDRWVVKYEKVFKLGFAQYGGTGTSAAFQSFANNDFQLSHEFDIDILPMIPKNYIYDDNNAIPETRGLFCAFEVVNCYGTTNSAASIKAEVHFQQLLEYTDI